jgi:hypothetical protein
MKFCLLLYTLIELLLLFLICFEIVACQEIAYLSNYVHLTFWEIIEIVRIDGLHSDILE